MIATQKGSVFRLLAWQWLHCLEFLLGGALASLTFLVLGLDWMVLPTAPVTVVGAALGIFVSFRANVGYNRWWEGRQLWGRLVNTSRLLATQVTTYLPKEQQERVLLTHCAFVHLLRCELRDDDPFADEQVQRVFALAQLDPAAFQREPSKAHALLHRAYAALVEAADAGQLDARRLQSMDTAFAVLLDVQGGCERIKRTPVPRGYAFIAERLIVAFSLVFPFSVVRELGAAVIPLNVLVCLAFTLISEAGRVLEDPFTHFWNSLPISSISLNIERNVRARLGHTELPAPLPVDKRGVLW